MAIYKGEDKLVRFWKGSNKVSRVWKGSNLIFGYPSGKVLFEQSSQGTYQLTLEYDTKCDIKMVGGGSGGIMTMSSGSTMFFGGGSGAYIQGECIISAGTYEIVVGNAATNIGQNGGDTSFYNQIAGGGKGTNGGTATITISGLVGTRGNNGNLSTRGSSVYGNYGQGGLAGSGSTAGYVRITVI